MNPSLPGFLGWLRRRAENVAAALLAAVFISFILQILFRYVLAWPVGWTIEVSTLAWMWLVLWGAAFVVTERDEIRFDIIYGAVPDRVRRGFAVVTGLALILLLARSLPATIEYVEFMKVEKVSYIDIPLNYVFSIYVVFAVAAIVRYAWIIVEAIRGRTPDLTDPSHLREE
ncbi:TRAP-type C4-dicarboxylate transport system, small permease component [Hartmannibacter diazotrophicus]|uniref:TRAP transporter small permease protein n=1 Tax=Hartmannibacter diazotrophicus TaxID=1482074 RepID=A0A2C9D6A8_9HYPH|nr:TRAP transporter small permease subunit [Hartmannibacter diazotrophicus]SON55678.1 TRAP-type C4-dicarboxylate transport system, small permease component [Hartmannibacter diazotrophicus]